MIRRPPRSTQGVSSAASDVYKRQWYQRRVHGISSKSLDTCMFGVYNRGMGFAATRKLAEHQECLSQIEHKLGKPISQAIEDIKTLRDFDNYFTSKQHGFGTADMYYRCISIGQKIHDLKIPMLSINALDDPLVPVETLPYDDALVNKNYILATHPCGGHVGFFTGVIPHSWFPQPVFEFFSALHLTGF
eukprot:TRINITY_DN15094_c0_g1_i3.p1 TRINITY_DN15094_c0_g1~~TRINITY_DN15094_c0_g1_i3.p1  ORF type:complete len:189 (-),score=37.74 TRINITY_DN15094_c0_g1_i3:46-612(-)